MADKRHRKHVRHDPKPTFVTRINSFIADNLAKVLSSMWLFWILLVAIVASYIMQPPQGAFDISLFFISTAFQGIALPVLAFVSNIQGDRQQAQLNKMQSEIEEELKLVRELLEDVKAGQAQIAQNACEYASQSS